MRETVPSLRESVRHRRPERASTPTPPAILAETSMTSTDLDKLDIEQLSDLLANAQAEMAAREKHNRKELRTELERRVAAEGYQLADIFPELRAASSAPGRRKRPPRYRDPQSPDHSWSGVGRTPKWVQAIVDERGIDVAAFKSIPMYRIHTAD